MIFRYLSRRKCPAQIAKNRLCIIVSHQSPRHHTGTVQYIELLRQELLQVVARYVQVEPNQVQVHLNQSGRHTQLEMNILLPDS